MNPLSIDKIPFIGVWGALIAMCVQSMVPITLGKPADNRAIVTDIGHDCITFIIEFNVPAIEKKPCLTTCGLKWLGKTTNTPRKCLSARYTLRMERQTALLPMFSASPTAYRNVPLAKKRKAMHTVCAVVNARLR